MRDIAAAEVGMRRWYVPGGYIRAIGALPFWHSDLVLEGFEKSGITTKAMLAYAVLQARSDAICYRHPLVETLIDYDVCGFHVAANRWW